MKNENNLSIDEYDDIKTREALLIRKSDELGREIGESVVTPQYEISSIRKDDTVEVSVISKSLNKRDKKGEELAAAHELVREYNKQNHTDYENPELYPDQNSSIDVTCNSKSGKYPKLYIQVTVSDQEGFANMGKGKSFERQTTSSYNFFSEMWKEAIAKKSEKKYTKQDRQTLILALYGWPLAYKSDLVKFKEKEASFLQGADFREVWFVGVDVGGYVIRLFP